MKNEMESVRMEQRFNTITRNYSRKEGPEMFSLTSSRQIEVESTFDRQRAENLIALFDVEMQALMEMMNIEFVTKDFYNSRMLVFVKMFSGFVKLLETEMESGKLTRHQVYLNDSTIDEVYARVGKYFESDRREVSVKFKDEVANVVEVTESVKVDEVVEVTKPKVVIEIPVEREVTETVETVENVETVEVEEVEEVEEVVVEEVKEDVKESTIEPEVKKGSSLAETELDKLLGSSNTDLDDFLT